MTMKKILIDLGHPAHIHYFRNTIKDLEGKGYKFKIIARDKEVLQDLLKEYDFAYVNRGKGKNSLLGKMWYTLYADLIVLIQALMFRPNIFLSFASPYAAQVAWVLRKPHIAMDDTEHATLGRLMYAPFSKTILNPSFYKKRFSDKQFFFDSYTELFYLHPDYHTPNPEIIKQYNLDVNDKYFILRLVAWNASHDIGHQGLNINTTREIVKKLEQYGRVIISSEGDLPKDLKPYELNLNPSHFHDILAYSSLYIGEGSTTAAECSVLGTTNILINSLELSNIEEHEKNYGLSIHLRDAEHLFEKLDELIANNFNKAHNDDAVKRLISDKINPTKFLIDFIERYPESAKKF
jgi:hypothetical protein